MTSSQVSLFGSPLERTTPEPPEDSPSRTPPPITRFGAETFRQWLAGFVSAEPPAKTTDAEEQKRELVEFLAVCPLVYDLPDRKPMWEKIGNAASAAVETSQGELMMWCNDVLEAIGAKHGRVASCEPIAIIMRRLELRSDMWRAGAVVLVKRLAFVLPVLARDRWGAIKLERGLSDAD